MGCLAGCRCPEHAAPSPGPQCAAHSPPPSIYSPRFTVKRRALVIYVIELYAKIGISIRVMIVLFCLFGTV